MLPGSNAQKDKTRITWLMPVKNGMPFLPATLEALAAQTYRNVELLVWDNGSTDGTLEELQKWIPSRLPGRIVTDRPLGVGTSLAAMVEEATTDLCARIDADDICLPDRLEKQVAYLQAHPEVAVVGTQYIGLKGNGSLYESVSNLPLQHDDIVLYMFYMNPIAHPTVLFRRAAILAAGNYMDRPNCEDYDLWLRVAANHRLANMDEPLLHYRIHEKSTTQIAIVENRLQGDRSSEPALKTPNRLKAAMNSAFAERAMTLYGCSSESALRLREKRHLCALGVLLNVARHRAKIQKCSLIQVVRSEAFYHAAWQTTAPTDVASRLLLSALHPGYGIKVLSNRLRQNRINPVKRQEYLSPRHV